MYFTLYDSTLHDFDSVNVEFPKDIPTDDSLDGISVDTVLNSFKGLK